MLFKTKKKRDIVVGICLVTSQTKYIEDEYRKKLHNSNEFEDFFQLFEATCNKYLPGYDDCDEFCSSIGQNLNREHPAYKSLLQDANKAMIKYYGEIDDTLSDIIVCTSVITNVGIKNTLSKPNLAGIILTIEVPSYFIDDINIRLKQGKTKGWLIENNPVLSFPWGVICSHVSNVYDGDVKTFFQHITIK